MADIINLRRARKTKLREDKVKIASANRTKFGRSKVEKNVTTILNTKATQQLDGKNLKD